MPTERAAVRFGKLIGMKSVNCGRLAGFVKHLTDVSVARRERWRASPLSEIGRTAAGQHFVIGEHAWLKSIASW
jgi:hypothetical protein